MKYVFIINSHTTFLTAFGVIKLEHINNHNVILIYTRNYKNSLLDLKCKIVNFTTEDEFCSKNAQRGGLKLRKCIALVDNVIKVNIREEFYLYFPHLQMNMSQLFYTHPLCKKGAYLQEGGFGQPKKFITKFTLKDNFKNFIINKILRKSSRFVRPVGWYQPNFLQKQSVINTYALDNDYFRGLPSINHIITWPKVNLNIDLASDYPIFVFDGFINNGLIEKEFYMNACDIVIKDFCKTINYVKFHSNQDKDQRTSIENMFIALGKKVIILDDSVPFELILSSLDNLTIVGFSSSLLKFAYELGHCVYANDNILRQSTKYAKFIADTAYPYMYDVLPKTTKKVNRWELSRD